MAEVSHALSLLRQEASITEEVLGALNRCQSGTRLDANARAAIRKALVLLRGKEAHLAKANEALNAHQKLHAEVESLRREVRSRQQQVQDCARRLTEADKVLRGPLEDAKRLLEAGRKAEAAEIHVGDIVDYAQRISGITSAPSYWRPGMAMVGFAPPAPRPEMMRAGALSAFAANAGTSLSSLELLRIAHDLDRPPDSSASRVAAAAAAAVGRAVAGTAGSGASGSSSSNGTDSSNSSPSDGPRKRRETSAVGDLAGGKGGPAAKREAWEGGESDDGSGKGKGKSSKTGGAPAGASYARATPPKRPKISLDLDDLDSDDDEDSSGDD